MGHLILAALTALLMAQCALGGVETTLSILSHNLYIMPMFLFPTLGQNKRAKLIAASDYVKGHDVVIFEEVWEKAPRDLLVQALKDQYPHWTEVIGLAENQWDGTTGRNQQTWSENGGVMIMSKWPIVERRQHFYTSACGVDWFALKGFAYVRLNRAGTPIHIIGTHLQSNDDMCVNTDSSAIIRRTQLLEIRKFIDKLNIPLTDLIILAGDLNIERNSEEFHSLLSILQAEPPTSWSGGPFTFDPVHNSLGAANSKDSVQQNLDYILTIGSHANVVSNDLKVINAEAPPIFDLDKEYHDYSDHYPIVSTIKAIL